MTLFYKLILFSFLTFSILFTFLSYADEIPHPPEYKHFLNVQQPKYEEISNKKFWLSRIELGNCIASYNTDMDSIDEKTIREIEKKCIKNENDRKILEGMFCSQKFSEALQFTETEMINIRNSQNSHLMIGAGIQSEYENTQGLNFLELASDAEHDIGLALVSLIDRRLALYSNKESKPDVYTKMRKSIQKMVDFDKDNALSYYLYAAILNIAKKNDEAIRQLKKGNSKRQFNSYSAERYLAVVEASESVGYSKFTSRHYAMSFFAPVDIYSNLISLCSSLVKESKNLGVRKECFLMGTKICFESNNIFEKMQGLIIQSIALRDSSNPGDSETLKDVNKIQRSTAKKGSSLLKIPFKEIPEDIWIQYHDMFFEKGEEASIKFLEVFYDKKQVNATDNKQINQ